LNPVVTVRRLAGVVAVTVLALAYVVAAREIRRLDLAGRVATPPNRPWLVPPLCRLADAAGPLGLRPGREIDVVPLRSLPPADGAARLDRRSEIPRPSPVEGRGQL
jgi:hypothetical protein